MAEEKSTEIQHPKPTPEQKAHPAYKQAIKDGASPETLAGLTFPIQSEEVDENGRLLEEPKPEKVNAPAGEKTQPEAKAETEAKATPPIHTPEPSGKSE